MEKKYEKLVLIIKELAADDIKEKVNFESHLFDEGILDSFGLIELVSAIEREYEITLNNEDLIIENFSTVARIYQFIEENKR